ncbi:MAG: hypothetical protein WBA91_07820 [Paracoccaceae bacterium]
MTALNQYQRLESIGLWRETPDAQRREVIVSFGDATLILREQPSDRALAHWSLPAIERLNPGRTPARFAPGPDAGEELEIEDETMIAALSKVHHLIEARRPHPGRLRGALLLSAAGLIALAGFVWLPGALINHTAGVLPSPTRAEIGRVIIDDLARLTGRPCNAPDGALALASLGKRLLGNDGQILILPDGLETSLHVPGPYIALGRKLVEDHDNPEVVAGFAIAEKLREEARDPLPAALRYAGLRAVLHLLTSGEVPQEAFHGYGERLLRKKQRPVDDSTLLARLAKVGIGATAYARALDPTGETTAALAAGDPYASGGASASEPLLNDTDWVALQGICDR